MNCHGDKKEKKGIHKHSPLKHMLHMVLCCGLPIVIIGILPFISRFSPGVGKILGAIAPFICPLMMIAMLPMMLGGRKKSSCCDDTREMPEHSKSIDLKKTIEE